MLYRFPAYPDLFLTTRAARIILCEAQNWRCCLCGERMDEPETPRMGHDAVFPDDATIEHIIERYKGGTNNWTNLAASHFKCNSDRNIGDYNQIDPWPLSCDFEPLVEGAMLIAYREARARMLGLLPR